MSTEATSTQGGATFFPIDEIDWVDERKLGDAPLELIEEGERLGARRKMLAAGECGFHSQYSVMPAGYTVPSHSHNHDELFVVLSGGCTMHGDGREVHAHDSMAISAGSRYGFTCGPEGMTFVVVRRDRAQTSL